MPTNKGRPATAQEYLASLPPERRKVVATLRTFVKRHLPKGYKEDMTWGVIGYGIPLSVYPDTYNGHPLSFCAIAANKSSYSLHLMAVYGDAKNEAWLREQFAKAGKKLDMGKACIRFKSLDDLDLDAIGTLIAAIPPEKYIARYEASRRR